MPTYAQHKMTKHGGAGRAYFECSCGFVWLGTYFGVKHRRAEAEREHAIAVLAAERSAVYSALDAGEVTVGEWEVQTGVLTGKMDSLRV